METLIRPAQDTQFVFAEPLGVQNERVDRFYNDLLRGLTHKLNNLYAVVQGFSSLMMMSDELDESFVENISHMKDAAQSASALTEKILTAGGCSRVSIQTVRLDDYMGMVGPGLRRPIDERGVPLRWNMFPDLPNISADPTRFKEVLSELLKNAMEAAADARGEVIFEIVPSRQVAADGSRRVDVVITNTGSEIAPEKLKEVFRPFYTTKSSDHSGIGLTNAAMLAGQMNMPLGVRSGGGSVTFWLSCPVA